MVEQLKTRILNSPEWLISAGVFLVYWLVNKSYTGPAIMTDEIGYLANAALISGHIIDGANSWHAGYSFFLAPLFVIFSEPSQIWQAIMVLNAFLWAVSFLLLAQILKKLIPEISKKQLVAALLVSAIYPTWITMSGYVFTTTAFVFIYLLAILSLLFWKPDQLWTIIPHCLLVGYLYWIHPIGLAVCIASFIVVSFVSSKEKRYGSIILNLIIIVILVIVYQEVIDKWLISLATLEEYDPLSQHYSVFNTIFVGMLTYEFWLQLLVKSVGQISYLIVSSFGLVLFGIIASTKESSMLIIKCQHDNDSKFIKQSVYAFLVISLLVIIAMSVMLFSIIESRVDHWIYGRHVDKVVLPLIALGCSSFWRKKWLYGAAFFVFLTGLVLQRLADAAAANHLMHTVGFWPQYLILEANFFYWMTTASLVLILVCRAWQESKLGNLLVLSLIMTFFLVSAFISSIFHHSIIATQGTPTTFISMIRESYPPGTCIGFNPKGTSSLHIFQIQRYHLHLFHLYDYDYRRMWSEEWLKNCEGPYFTYHLDEFKEKQNVKLVGQDVLSHLYLLEKIDGRVINRLEKSGPVKDLYQASGWSINRSIIFEDSQLAEQSGPAGYYEHGSIFSTGDEGFIVLGPSIKVGPGEYRFNIWGEASDCEDSWVKVVAGSNEAQQVKYNINDNSKAEDKNISTGKFFLDGPINNLEIKVYASSGNNIRIDGFQIEYICNIEYEF